MCSVAFLFFLPFMAFRMTWGWSEFKNIMSILFPVSKCIDYGYLTREELMGQWYVEILFSDSYFGKTISHSVYINLHSH